MRGARLLQSFVIVAGLLLATAGVAGAAEDKKTEARRLYDEATAAFGVGNYAEAAEKYEGSFKLHPDAALLYNAAQAYRMAGNRARALQLYRNFLRLYGGNERAEDARTHVAALEKAIGEGETAGAGTQPAPPATTQPAPPATTQPPPGAAAPSAASLNAPAPRAETSPTLLEQQAPPPGSDEGQSLWTRPWFWVAVGAAVIGGTVAILLATRTDNYPNPTLGKLP
jgi:tetratricopeptide (TPR) repeat protein